MNRPPRNLGPAAQARSERALATLRSVVESKGLRLSSEWETILQATLERRGHFDASTLARALDRGHKRISASAVYRVILLMAEAGIVRPTPFSSGANRIYEVIFERSSPGHLTCQSCGAIFEFDSEGLSAFRREVAGTHGFDLMAHDHELHGVCSKCRVDRS